jgi:phospholipid/cholesterol/gamma-HCH transport system substrate-binding protein
VAPPLVKGRALARRRLSGLAFIVVMAVLIQLAVAIYQKRFVDVVDVSLKTDRIGNQLSAHADVKVRGIVVGEVRRVHSEGGVATLELALDPDKAPLLPKDVRAQLLPKTLFGEKQVVLVLPETPEGGGYLEDGDVIEQDRSATALETETALNNLLPLLKALRPQQVSQVLSSLSASLRDRGNKVGQNTVLMEAYFRRLNPHLPAVGDDLRGLADLANNLAATSPDLLEELDNLAASSRSLVDEKAALETFLASTSDFSATATSFVKENEQRLVRLSRDSVEPLKVFASYSDTYPCFLDRLAFAEIEGERVFGGGQPGLHITLEATQDKKGYRAGDEPQYKEKLNAHCFGLGKTPIRPFPEYANTQDGYRDGEPPADPGEGPGGCCQVARAWQPETLAAPREEVVRRATLPEGTTALDALLLAPIIGVG